MTYKEIINDEVFKNSFGGKNNKAAGKQKSTSDENEKTPPHKYVSAFEKVLNSKNYDIRHRPPQRAYKFNCKSPQEKDDNKAIEKAFNRFAQTNIKLGLVPALTNIFWFARYKIPGWQLVLLAICSLIIFLYDQKLSLHLLWLLPWLAIAGYYGPAWRIYNHAVKIAEGRGDGEITIDRTREKQDEIDIFKPSKLNVWLCFFVIAASVLLNIGLREYKISSQKLAKAVALYADGIVSEQFSNDLTADSVFALLVEKPQYYQIDKRPKIFTKQNNAAIVTINMAKIVRLFLENDTICAAISKQKFSTCKDFMQDKAYFSRARFTAFLLSGLTLPITARVALKYSAKNLQNGELSVTLTDYFIEHHTGNNGK